MVEIDTDIIRRASTGDRTAFEKLYRASSGFVYSVALRITNNRTGAEDVTQEVFLKLYRNLGRFGFRSRFSTWLYRITVNTAINFTKKASTRLAGSNEYNDTRQYASVGGDTSDKVSRNDEKRMFQELLTKLTPEQRACVVLRNIEGFSYKEIADMLRVNINTVRTRLKRARERLLFLGKEVVKNEL